MFPPQGRRRQRFEPRARGGQVPGPAAAPAVVPYDYAATFELSGTPGRIIHDVINVSTDGVFVATAIGYGFEEDRGRDIGFSGVAANAMFVPGNVTLGQLPVSALIDGFRINPFHERYVFEADGRATLGAAMPIPARQLSNVPQLDRVSREDPQVDGERSLLQRVTPKNEISFLFSIVDSGTGRELQEAPIHNLASLGISSGERPFRQLAQPMAFLPRSSIRLQVIERTENIRGTLFIVLYGYRLLTANCPEHLVRTVRGDWPCPTETIGSPSAHVIPFDYAAAFNLAGIPGRVIETEVPINVEGGYVATAIGYGLATDPTVLRIDWARIADVQPPPAQLPIAANAMANWLQARQAWRNAGMVGPPPATPVVADIGRLPLRVFSPDALADGIRIRPSFVRVALRDNGLLALNLPATLVEEMFESLNRPEDVEFRYRIFESGRGVELQNRNIHCIAGLGIANGDRPFKRLSRPLTFHPRSTIRVALEERSGRGTLHMVFQGYKLLARTSAGAA
jgi:hypothetical protein